MLVVFPCLSEDNGGDVSNIVPLPPPDGSCRSRGYRKTCPVLACESRHLAFLEALQVGATHPIMARAADGERFLRSIKPYLNHNSRKNDV